MTKPMPRHRHRISDALLLAAFLLVITLPVVDKLSGKLLGFRLDRVQRVHELRVLARFPAFMPERVERPASPCDDAAPEATAAQPQPGPTLRDRLLEYLDAVDRWPGAIEAWWNDRFGFRDELIFCHNYGKVFWLNVPPGKSPTQFDLDPVIDQGAWPPSQVLLGRYSRFGQTDYEYRRWLYYYQTIDYWRGVRFLSEEDLAYVRRFWAERRAWAERTGVRHVLVVVPAKATVYPQYLPDFVRKVRERTIADQIAEVFHDTPYQRFIDLRPTLIEAGRDELTYLITDTHWNPLGAFLGYQAIMNAVAQWFPAAQPYPREHFAEPARIIHGGDMAQLMGMPHILNEVQRIFVPRTEPEAEKTTDVLTHCGRFAPPADPPYGFERARPDLPRAVMHQDSYLYKYLDRFLAEHFERIVFYRTLELDEELVRRERADVLIEEVTERLLVYIPFLQRAHEQPPAPPQPPPRRYPLEVLYVITALTLLAAPVPAWLVFSGWHVRRRDRRSAAAGNS